MSSIWYVYLALSKDNQLYCGISTNPARRVNEHNSSKKGAKWARAHRPLKLVWGERVGSKSDALKRECQIKAMSAAEKRKLAGLNENN
jgi:putative endonuclease